MNKKLSHFLPGLTLAVILSLNVVGCSQVNPPTSTVSFDKINNNNLKSGIIVLKIADLVSNTGFKTKANFSDSSIKQIKIDVDGYGVSTVSRTVKWDKASNQTVAISVPPGKNRVVSVTGLTDIGTPVAKIMGLTDVNQDTTTILSLNYGSTPAARVMSNIINSSRPEVANKVDGEKLKRLMYNITGYRDSDNTYGLNGINPLQVDVYAISQRIISNDGDIDTNNTDDINVAVTQGKLKVYVKDKQGNPIISGVALRLNDITGNNPVSNGSYSNIAADQGTWEITAKAYVNANGTSIIVPLNSEDARNIILNGGNVLYAKQTVTVKGTQEQEITLTLDTLKVKEIQLYNKEKKLDSNFEAQVYQPLDLDARVIFEDGSYSNDEVIWELQNKDVFNIGSDGMLTSYKTGSGNFTVRSILDRDKTAFYSVTIKDTGVAPVITSFGKPVDGNITIFGRNFDDLVPFNNIVRINGVKAEVIAVTTDSIKVKIPNSGNVGTGYITVENSRGKDTSENQFVGGPLAAGSGSVSIAGGDFIMGSPNVNQTSFISTMITELNREAQINNFVANTTVADSTIPSSATLVSALTSSQITSIVAYTTVDDSTLRNDITSASATTTIAQLFSNTKYHTLDNVGIRTTTALSAMTDTLVSYVTSQTTVNKDVLRAAINAGTQTSTFYSLLLTLKNYSTANSISYGPSESPMVKVSVSPFSIDTYEVSNKDYKAFVDADGYNKRDYWTAEGWQWKLSNSISKPLFWDDPKYNQDNFPVVGVSWYEAYAFAKWSGKRLPTEAEWELAAKGKPSTTYPWGNKLYPWGNTDPSTNKLANGYFGAEGSTDGFKYMTDVNSFMSATTDGRTSEGAVNMSGNVAEWVNDWYQYEYYGRNTEFVNPLGPVTGTFKGTRGGSWSNGKNELRNTYRDLFLRPESRNLNLGFRCVGVSNN